MKLYIDMEGPPPKRGDLLQTNLASRRERTCLILRARLRRTSPNGLPRYNVVAVRWWELEPDIRMRLYHSAERNGGQQVIHVKRYPPKKRETFEQFMRRRIP